MRQTMGVGVADSQPGTNDMNDGATQLAVIDGVVTDVKKVNGQLYHNRIFTSFEEEADTILNEESVIKVQHKFTGNPVIDPGFQSDTFSSGFAGSGYRINKDTASDFASPNTAYNIEIDNMIVRGTLSVYELLIQQIRATNGAIFVTSAAKVASASGLSASDDVGTITFDDPSGKSLCPFADGDIIMMQRVDPGSTVSQSAAGNASGVVKKLVYKVNGAPNGAQITVENGGFDNLSYPVEGDEFVRIGNDGTTSNRDGVIYLTSDDSNAPYIDIKSDIDTYAKWYGNVPKVRLGNLSGITYDSASLSGFGLYSENVFLTGKIIATSGKIGGVNLVSDKIYVGTGTVNNTNTGFYLDDSGNFSLKDKLYWNGTSLAIEGAITATSGTFTGAINASSGTFTGYVAGGNMKFGVDVSGSNDGLFIDANDYWYDNGNFSLGNGNLTWNGSALSVTGGGTFTGALSGGTISIGSSNSIFKADSNGIYLGNATFGSAPFRVTPDGQLTATSGTFSGSITGASGTFSGNLQIGSGESVFKADSNGIYLGNETFANAEFRVTPAGVVTATNIVLTAAAGSTFNNGTISGFSAGSSGFSSASFSCNTDGSVSLAANAFKVYANGDLYLHPSATDISAAAGGSAVRRGIIQYDTSDTSGDYWKQYHDFTDNDYKFLYNGSNMLEIGNTGIVEATAGYKTNGDIFVIANQNRCRMSSSSTTESWYEVYNSHSALDADTALGGIRAYCNDTNSGWNALMRFTTSNDSGSVKINFRTGNSGTAFWQKFDGNGDVFNHSDDTHWDTDSDERSKTDIVNISNAVTTLGNLRPVTFKYTSDFLEKRPTHDRKRWGFLAQEFKTIIPEAVTIEENYGYDDFHTMNTNMLVPLLVKAVQELKAEVEELKNSG